MQQQKNARAARAPGDAASTIATAPGQHRPHKRRAAKQQQPVTRFRDRIVELRRVKASTLLDNEKNWRRHPDEQVGAMTSMLERIGITGALVARETKTGLQLIDGHVRKGIAGDELVPVLIVDLSPAEADVMLATFDPLAELAIMDAEALKKLLEEAAGDDEEDDAFMRKLLADIERDVAVEVEASGSDKREIEGMALEPHEHYDYLVVMCQTTQEWNVLCDRLALKPEKRRAKFGTARAIRATRLLEKLQAKA